MLSAVGKNMPTVGELQLSTNQSVDFYSQSSVLSMTTESTELGSKIPNTNCG